MPGPPAIDLLALAADLDGSIKGKLNDALDLISGIPPQLTEAEIRDAAAVVKADNLALGLIANGNAIGTVLAAVGAVGETVGSDGEQLDRIEYRANENSTDINECERLLGGVLTLLFGGPASVNGSPHDWLINVYEGWNSDTQPPEYLPGLVVQLMNNQKQIFDLISAICLTVGHYNLDASGVAAFGADSTSGLVIGSGLVVLRDGKPALNPTLLTFQGRDGDYYPLTSGVLADVLNLLNIYPRP